MRFDPCRNVRRCRAAKYDVHSMPSSVTHSPCDANGQAPSGVPDETADLQAWIDSVPDGTGRPRPVLPGRSTDPDQWRVLEFPHGRCIRMDGHLTIRDRHYLIFDGEGVTLDQHLKPATARSTRNGATWNGSGGWDVVRGSSLQWHSFNIVGNHIHSEMQTEWNGGSSVRKTRVTTFGMCHASVPGPPSNSYCEWQYGWGIRGSQNVLLDGNQSRDTHGDGVAIEWGPGINLMPRDITIQNHSVYRSGRQGISIIAGEGITIKDSYIEGSASNAIDLEPERWEDDRFPVRDVIITRNRFGESHAATLVANGRCADIANIEYSYNDQISSNISRIPAIEMIAPSTTPLGTPCSSQRGPITIAFNIFRIRETGTEGDAAVSIEGYSNVTFNSNSVNHSCHPATPACTADQPPVILRGGSGHIVSGNDLSIGERAHHWRWAYSHNGHSYRREDRRRYQHHLDSMSPFMCSMAIRPMRCP
jgi:hypothetical protein